MITTRLVDDSQIPTFDLVIKDKRLSKLNVMHEVDCENEVYLQYVYRDKSSNSRFKTPGTTLFSNVLIGQKAFQNNNFKASDTLVLPKQFGK